MGRTQIKYVVHPGFVLSKQDKDTHYVGYNRLVALYGVDPRNCELYNPVEFYPANSMYEDTVHLYPRWDGNYSLETKHKASKGTTNV